MKTPFTHDDIIDIEQFKKIIKYIIDKYGKSVNKKNLVLTNNDWCFCTHESVIDIITNLKSTLSILKLVIDNNNSCLLKYQTDTATDNLYRQSFKSLIISYKTQIEDINTALNIANTVLNIIKTVGLIQDTVDN
jgi:hypothetical protein